MLYNGEKVEIVMKITLQKFDPLPGCVHNRKIGSGADCQARRWKFMNNEGGLSLPKVPNLTFP